MKFICDECKQEFEADPDSMVESELTMQHEPPEGEEWKHDGHKAELSPEDRERAKAEMQIDDEQLDRLLAGESVSVGACICTKCQDDMHEDQYGFRP